MINNPFAEDGIIACQYCESGEYLYNEDGNQNSYCGQCGTRIDWPEDKDGWKNTNTDLPKYGVLCKIIPQMITHGDRIAQMAVVPFWQADFEEVFELDETERGECGFGSTGKQ